MIKYNFAIGDKLVMETKDKMLIATIADVNYEKALLEFEDGTSTWFLWHWVCRDFKKASLQ